MGRESDGFNVHVLACRLFVASEEAFDTADVQDGLLVQFVNRQVDHGGCGSAPCFQVRTVQKLKDGAQSVALNDNLPILNWNRQ